MLSDYGIERDIISILDDNSNAINISKNLGLYSCTKHIESCHHLIRDFFENKVVSLEFVLTKQQLVNIFTKSLDSPKFEFLRKSLGICLND